MDNFPGRGRKSEAGNIALNISTGEQARIPVGGGTILEFTIAELLPDVFRGNVKALASEQQDLSGVATVVKKNCRVQAGPLLRPYSGAGRGLLAQSAANVRKFTSPIGGLLGNANR